MTLVNWRDLAIVLLAFEALVLSLIPAAVFYLCIRGLSQVIKRLQTVSPRVQRFFARVAEGSDSTSRRVVAPIIGISAFAAQLRHWRMAMTQPNLNQREV